MRLKLFTAFTFALLYTGLLGAQDLTTTIKQVKVGNSLREAQQYDNSETWLLLGLSSAKKINNQYWQAVAYEYLGILYKDVKEGDRSSAYLDSALRIYNAIGMNLSAKAIKDIMGDVKDSNDDLYAGLEVGAKGVKYSIIRIRRVNGAISFVNVAKGSTDVGTFTLTDPAIDETAKAIAKYWDQVQQGSTPVTADHIFVAVSSGVKQELDKKPGTQDKLRTAMLAALPNKNIPIGFLTPEMEVSLTIKGTISSRDLLRSTSMDIGSGNTKGGYYKTKEDIETVSVPWGSGTFGRKIGDKSDKLAFAEAFYRDSIFLNDAVQRKSRFSNREWSFLSGGIVWVVTSWLAPEKVKEPFIEFSAKDVDRFLKLVATDSGFRKFQEGPDFTKITDDNILQAAKSQWEDTKQFSNANLIAGGTILKGFMDQLNQSARKRFFFVRSGEVGWISGYIAMQIAEKYKVTKPD